MPSITPMSTILREEVLMAPMVSTCEVHRAAAKRSTFILASWLPDARCRRFA
jgi:hypothetical protein